MFSSFLHSGLRRSLFGLFLGISNPLTIMNSVFSTSVSSVRDCRQQSPVVKAKDFELSSPDSNPRSFTLALYTLGS